MLCQYLVEASFQPEDLAGLNLNVGGLPLCTAERLVEHDSTIRQRRTPARGAGRQQYRAHRRGESHTDRRNRRLDVLHGVIDRESAVDDTAGRVDVDINVSLGILAGQEEELRNGKVGNLVVDRRADDNDVLLQQAAEDVVRPFASRGLFEDRKSVV